MVNMSGPGRGGGSKISLHKESFSSDARAESIEATEVASESALNVLQSIARGQAPRSGTGQPEVAHVMAALEKKGLLTQIPASQYESSRSAASLALADISKEIQRWEKLHEDSLQPFFESQQRLDELQGREERLSMMGRRYSHQLSRANRGAATLSNRFLRLFGFGKDYRFDIGRAERQIERVEQELCDLTEEREVLEESHRPVQKLNEEMSEGLSNAKELYEEKRKVLEALDRYVRTPHGALRLTAEGEKMLKLLRGRGAAFPGVDIDQASEAIEAQNRVIVSRLTKADHIREAFEQTRLRSGFLLEGYEQTSDYSQTIGYITARFLDIPGSVQENVASFWEMMEDLNEDPFPANAAFVLDLMVEGSSLKDGLKRVGKALQALKEAGLKEKDEGTARKALKLCYREIDHRIDFGRSVGLIVPSKPSLHNPTVLQIRDALMLSRLAGTQIDAQSRPDNSRSLEQIFESYDSDMNWMGSSLFRAVHSPDLGSLPDISDVDDLSKMDKHIGGLVGIDSTQQPALHDIARLLNYVPGSAQAKAMTFALSFNTAKARGVKNAPVEVLAACWPAVCEIMQSDLTKQAFKLNKRIDRLERRIEQERDPAKKTRWYEILAETYSQMEGLFDNQGGLSFDGVNLEKLKDNILQLEVDRLVSENTPRRRGGGRRLRRGAARTAVARRTRW